MYRKYFLTILFLALGGTLKGQVVFTSSHLPIIIIDTDEKPIVNDAKITAGMKIIYNGENKLNYTTDPALEYNGFIGIEIRGSSSLRFPKKSYGIETRNISGENFNVSILGMPKENDWVLYAPYSDKTLIRNVLTYQISNKLGRYAARTRFCELILNGEYEGVYVFTEKIKQDKNRVNISRLEEKDVDISGGYILQIDRLDSPGWYSDYPSATDSNKKIFYQYIFPRDDEITDDQKNYIKNRMKNFENILASEEFNNTDSGFIKYLDVDSFVDYLIISELTKNVDAYRLSTYMYKDRDDIDPRLKLGPVWDFNIAFGNADFYRGEFVDGFQVTLKMEDEYQQPFWFAKLFNDKFIFNKFSQRWNILRKGALASDSIMIFIDNHIRELGAAIDRNFGRWKILGIYVWPNPIVYNSYENEVEQLKNWIIKRLEWMDANVNQDYSLISWVQNFEIAVDSGGTVNVAKDNFFVETLNIDSINFIPVSGNLIINSFPGYAAFTNLGKEVKYFIAAGFNNGSIVESSPLYSVRSDITDIRKENKTVNDYSLHQNYPNPFNPRTTIEYSIQNQTSGGQGLEFTSLIVYDILGRMVATLVNEYQPPGYYKVVFDASSGGGGLTSGVYFYVLQTDKFRKTRKMILMK